MGFWSLEGGDLETEGGNKKHTTEGKDSTLVLTEVLCSNVKELDEAVFCLERTSFSGSWEELFKSSRPGLHGSAGSHEYTEERPNGQARKTLKPIVAYAVPCDLFPQPPQTTPVPWYLHFLQQEPRSWRCLHFSTCCWDTFERQVNSKSRKVCVCVCITYELWSLETFH